MPNAWNLFALFNSLLRICEVGGFFMHPPPLGGIYVLQMFFFHQPHDSA